MGKRTLHKTYKHTLGAYPPDYYHEYVYNVQLPRAGTYNLKVVMTIGKASTSGTATLKVSAKGLVALSTRAGASLLAASNALTRSVKPVLRDDAVGVAAFQRAERSAVAR
jgi:hypothetical protein